MQAGSCNCRSGDVQCGTSFCLCAELGVAVTPPWPRIGHGAVAGRAKTANRCSDVPLVPHRRRLRCADFSYPARPTLRVLSGVSLQINPGEVRARRRMRGLRSAPHVCMVGRACCGIRTRSSPGGGAVSSAGRHGGRDMRGWPLSGAVGTMTCTCCTTARRCSGCGGSLLLAGAVRGTAHEC